MNTNTPALKIARQLRANQTGFTNQAVHTVCDALIETHAELTSALRALRGVEWQTDAEWQVESCPECGNDQSDGHTHTCAIGILLAKWSPQ